jgi:hypothetical protein
VASATAGVGLVTVGAGVYGGKELALHLRTPVVAAMPDDPGTAAVLSNGGERHHARLLRAAAKAEAQVRRLVDSGRATPAGQRPTTAPIVASEVGSGRWPTLRHLAARRNHNVPPGLAGAVRAAVNGHNRPLHTRHHDLPVSRQLSPPPRFVRKGDDGLSRRTSARACGFIKVDVSPGSRR